MKGIIISLFLLSFLLACNKKSENIQIEPADCPIKYLRGEYREYQDSGLYSPQIGLMRFENDSTLKFNNSFVGYLINGDCTITFNTIIHQTYEVIVCDECACDVYFKKVDSTLNYTDRCLKKI